MQEVQAVFVDCDGVLYDVDLLTYEEMVSACKSAACELGLNLNNFDEVRENLKQKGFHGLYNIILKLCQAQNKSFEKIADRMVEFLDYSRILPNPDLLVLLQQVAEKKKVYIFTNNTYAHLNRIFMCLFDKNLVQSGIKAITIEDTYSDGFFYPKRMENVFTSWCQKIGVLPQNTLMLDDTDNVIQAAKEQGLQYQQIQSARMTQEILQELL